MSPFRAYGQWHLGALALMVLAIAGFNIWVDPMRVFRAEPRPIPPVALRWPPTVRAEAYLKREPSLVWVGDSRPIVGIPQNDSLLKSYSGYVLAHRAATLRECRQIVDFAVRTNPELETVMLGLGLRMCLSWLKPKDEFLVSRFNPRQNIPKYYLHNLINNSVTERSIRSLFFRPRRVVCRGHLVSRQTAVQHWQMMDEHYRSYELAGDWSTLETRLDDLRAIVERCQDRGVQLVFVILPEHYELLSLVDEVDRWPHYCYWLGAVVRIAEQADPPVPVWDFTAPAVATLETTPVEETLVHQDRYFFDFTHFSPKVGHSVLRQILDQDEPTDAKPDRIGQDASRPPNVDGTPPLVRGVLLDSGMLHDYLETVRRGILVYEAGYRTTASRSDGEVRAITPSAILEPLDDWDVFMPPEKPDGKDPDEESIDVPDGACLWDPEPQETQCS